MTDTVADHRNVVRRPAIMIPGEPLLLSTDALEVMTRFEEFAMLSGIPGDAILSDPIVALPLPLRPAQWSDGRRRWDGTHASFMWHPLMWLPEHLSSRFMLTIDDGDEEIEPDDIWALRVAMELSQSGLYDVDTGTWVDVLALAGLDINEEATLTRVQAWLDGSPDQVLDGIDLTPFMVEDQEYVLREAAQAAYPLRRSLWARLAADLIDKFDEAVSAPEPLTRLQGVSTVSMLAEVTVSSTDTDGSNRDLWASAVTQCHEALESPDRVNADALTQMVEMLRSELVEVKSRNQAWLDELEAVMDEPAT